MNDAHPWSRQRLYERYAVDLPVRLRTPSPRLVDRAVNLSTGGIAIRTSEPLPPESQVTLGVQLPPLLELVNVFGTVVWSDGEQMGVRFEYFDPRVADFIERLARQSERL